MKSGNIKANIGFNTETSLNISIVVDHSTFQGGAAGDFEKKCMQAYSFTRQLPKAIYSRLVSSKKACHTEKRACIHNPQEKIISAWKGFKKIRAYTKSPPTLSKVNCSTA